MVNSKKQTRPKNKYNNGVRYFMEEVGREVVCTVQGMAIWTKNNILNAKS